MLLKDFIKLTSTSQHIRIIKYVHQDYVYTLFEGIITQIPKTILEYKILKSNPIV